ncbi:MAG: phosphodiesterase transmembrane protein [Rhodocyclaceae bacterium]|nr:MAG: phosphodiesterase transmembrane protein [Rhodocyclaceae bacterium]TND00275.1 MAG: phosphodiesterase transmembrane protein [Rhodocyclaceae bacterium]
MTLFRTLERRIAVVFVGLLVFVVLLMLLIVARSGEAIILAESQRQLEAGARNFSNLIDRDQRQLELAASVLTGDFGFREAIATQDRATVRSVLRNHGSRIGARVMMVVSLDGKVIVDTQPLGEAARAFPFGDLLRAAQQSGRSGGVALMDDALLYQIVIVPIMAPVRIAWVVMGFPVEDAWALEFSRASGLDVSVITGDGAIQASSLAPTLRSALKILQLTALGEQPRQLVLEGRNYHAVALPFGPQARVVLLHSLEHSEAAFRELERILEIIAGAGIALFVVGSFGLARRIAGPLNTLARAARRIEAGDYSQAVAVEAPDEIGQLAAGFENMRTGIAAREQKIIRLAYEDTLTGLPNRIRLTEYLAGLDPAAAAIVTVLGLDRFAPINDALGHPIGDRLLQQVGVRLAGLLPPRGMLARLWGDEFAFVVESPDQEWARKFAASVLAALREPIELDGQRLDVSGSLGIAFRPADGRDMDALLRRAELAMYSAKRRQCGYALAGDVGDGPPPEQLSLIGEMRHALERREFVLHYQPKLALASGRVVGAEALVRWQHPERGMMPPARFIPFAEQTGFIREITPWLLEEVAAQAAAWRQRGMAVVLSANLSARDLLNPELVGLMRKLLAAHELPAAALCLEITESALMEDPALALSHLAELAAIGLKLSIDDYGAGQASLSYLKSLPVHELKIDQSFIGSLAASPKDAAIVRSTIALGHALGLTVVAEGIEVEADLKWLAAAGCDIGQGYFISRPMAAPAFADWISAHAAIPSI